jgi:hypothetical protein
MTTIDLSSNIYLRLNSGDIQYSTDINFTIPTPIISWPTTITNNTGSNKTVYITNDLTLTATNQYFSIGSNNIIIDGQNKKVIINITWDYEYPGLIQNGTDSTNGKNNIIIKNLGLETMNGSTLANYAGWIGQQYMNKNASDCQVTNCYSTGNINGQRSGGIFGQYSYNSTATNCYSSGNISGFEAGGIFGEDSNNCTAINCYSTGDIYGPDVGRDFR